MRASMHRERAADGQPPGLLVPLLQQHVLVFAKVPAFAQQPVQDPEGLQHHAPCSAITATVETRARLKSPAATLVARCTSLHLPDR